MKKSTLIKIGLVVLGGILSYFLMTLPKVVVEDSKEIVDNNPIEDSSINSENNSHQADTLGEFLASKLKEKLNNSENINESIIFVDSLSDLYQKHGKFDSIAKYKELIVNKVSNLMTIRGVAKAWFDAFETSSNRTTKLEYGKKSAYWYEQATKYPEAESEATVMLAVLKVQLDAVQGIPPMEGIQQLKDVIAKNPNNILARRYLGEFYLKISSADVEKLKKGIAQFEYILKVDPNNINAQVNLIEAYIALPHVSKAKSHLSALEKIIGDDEFFKEFITSKKEQIKSL